MKKLLLTTALLSAATSAMAGKLEFVPAPLVPIAPPVVQAWTGPYVGVQAGLGNADFIVQGQRGVTMSGPVYGLHAGYLYDFGTLVVGAEVDYNLANITGFYDGEVVITDLYHVKARAGIDAGSALIYATAGYGYATVENFDGSDVYNTSGVFYGGGAEFNVTSNWTAGAEILFHDFNDVSGGGFYDIDLTTIQARASYHF